MQEDVPAWLSDDYEPDPESVAWAHRINDDMPPLSPAQKARLGMLLAPVRETLGRGTRPSRRCERSAA